MSLLNATYLRKTLARQRLFKEVFFSPLCLRRCLPWCGALAGENDRTPVGRGAEPTGRQSVGSELV